MLIKLKPFGMDIVKPSLTPSEKEELDKTLPKLAEDELFDMIENDEVIKLSGQQKYLYRLLLAISYHFDIELM